MEHLESIKLENCDFFLRDASFIEFFNRSAVDIQLMSQDSRSRIEFFEQMLNIYELTNQDSVEPKTFLIDKKPFWYKKLAELKVESNIHKQLEQNRLIQDILLESIQLLRQNQGNLTLSSEYNYRLLKIMKVHTAT